VISDQGFRTHFIDRCHAMGRVPVD